MLSVKILWLQRWDTPQPRLSGLPLWFQLLSLLSHFLYWLFLPCSLQPSRSCRRRRFVISSSTLNKEKGIVNKIRPRFLHSSIKNVAIDVKFRMRIKGDSNLESYTGSDYITQKIHIHPYVYKIVCQPRRFFFLILTFFKGERCVNLKTNRVIKDVEVFHLKGGERSTTRCSILTLHWIQYWRKTCHKNIIRLLEQIGMRAHYWYKCYISI